jgi:hypothetical protein
MRIMSWNCLGMGAAKQTLLTNYIAGQAIDFVFLQEGEATFSNATTIVTSEGHNHGSMLLFGRQDKATEFIEAASSNAFGIGPMGGVGRTANYNIVGDKTAYTDLDDSLVDYLKNDSILTWIKKPAQNFVNGKRVNKKKLSLRRGKFEGAGQPDVKKMINDDLLGPVQSRMNMLGHRRPKAVKIHANGMTVHYWHAPLGSDTKLSSIGFTSYNAIRQEGSGGELAVAANIVFAKHLGVDTQFPTNTILLGDLNITRTAVEDIYKTSNVLSSADGWCHIIAHSGVTLNQITNALDQTALGYSDHAPIVCDVS